MSQIEYLPEFREVAERILPQQARLFGAKLLGSVGVADPHNTLAEIISPDFNLAAMHPSERVIQRSLLRRDREFDPDFQRRLVVYQIRSNMAAGFLQRFFRTMYQGGFLDLRGIVEFTERNSTHFEDLLREADMWQRAKEGPKEIITAAIESTSDLILQGLGISFTGENASSAIPIFDDKQRPLGHRIDTSTSLFGVQASLFVPLDGNSRILIAPPHLKGHRNLND